MISIEEVQWLVEYKQLQLDSVIDKLTVKHAEMQELIDRGNHLAFLVLNGTEHEKNYAIKQWRKTVNSTKKNGIRRKKVAL